MALFGIAGGCSLLGAAKFTGSYTGSYGLKDDDGLISKAYIYYSAIVRCVRVGISVASIMADYKLSLRDSVTKGLSEEDAQLLWSKCHKRSAEKLLDTFKKNGGVYIKFGQHISALVYLLPDEYTETMKVLQNMCPQSSLDAVKSVIEADLRKPFHEIFAEFDHDPVGSASLAQVHRARLKTGEDVAVKVQHFYVGHFAPFDIALTDFMVKVVNWVFPEFEFGWLAVEMKENLPLELDFEHEASNCERLRNYFSKERTLLYLPEIFWSTKRTLCMEFIEGKNIDNTEFLRANGINPSKVFIELSKIFNKMIFDYGFLHADPHPGNVMVRAKKNGQFDIVLLDHGLYRVLPEDFRDNYARVWKALLSNDLDGIKKYSERLGGGNAYVLFSCVLTARSWEAVEGNSLSAAKTEDEALSIKTKVGGFVQDIAWLLAHVPRELLLVFKTNDLLRSIEAKLVDARHSGDLYISMLRSCITLIYRTDIQRSTGFMQSSLIFLSYIVDWVKLFVLSLFL